MSTTAESARLAAEGGEGFTGDDATEPGAVAKAERDGEVAGDAGAVETGVCAVVWARDPDCGILSGIFPIQCPK